MGLQPPLPREGSQTSPPFREPYGRQTFSPKEVDRLSPVGFPEGGAPLAAVGSPYTMHMQYVIFYYYLLFHSTCNMHIARFPLLLVTLTSLPLKTCLAHRGQPKEPPLLGTVQETDDQPLVAKLSASCAVPGRGGSFSCPPWAFVSGRVVRATSSNVVYIHIYIYVRKAGGGGGGGNA